jgi:hypothetical protein
MGDWMYSSIILDLVPTALAPAKDLPLGCPLARSLGEPHSGYGPYGEEKNLSPAGNRTYTSSLQLITIFTELSRLNSLFINH